jgi:MerR family redox-sensitive transcriptional activator SoxR
MESRIARLVQLRDRLGECIGCGCLSMRNCWLRNPWDRLSAQRPGPRLLRVP